MGELGEAREKSGIEQVLDQVVDADSHQCGLVKLPAPTGSGKTYAAMSHIADQLIKDGSNCRRYIFVTNIKRNLPIDLLLDLLQERGRPELAELVVNLDSNVDMLLNDLGAAKDVMRNKSFKPFEYWEKAPKQDGCKGVAAAKAQFDILNLPELQTAEKACDALKNARSLPDRTGTVKSMAIASAEENLAKAEHALRGKIASVFRSMCTRGGEGFRLMTTSEKRQLVETGWWEWLRLLYPSVLTYKKRVLFMSVNKLLVQNSPIIEPSASIWESDLLEGSVVVIDEFELSKNVINDFIIEESVRKMADSVSLFRALLGPALEGRAIGEESESASGLVLTSSLFRNPSNDETVAYRLRSQYEQIIKAAEDVYASLHLNKQFRLSEELRYKNQPFLFNDFKNDVVATGNKSWAAVHFLETQNQVQLGSGAPPYTDNNNGLQEGDYYPVPLLLERIEGIVRWFVGWVARVAENYQKVVAEDADEGKRPEISFDQAVGTVLSELNVMDEIHGQSNPTRERIIALAHDERARKIALDDDVRDTPANLCLHQTGFKVHSFAESAQHDTLTRMEHYGIPCTAERKLIELCSRNFVIVVSASLDIPSVLGNYDLDYVEGMLQKRFITLTSDQKALMQADYERSICHYDRVDIHVTKVADTNADGFYDWHAWLAVFDNEAEARAAFNRVAGEYDPEGETAFRQRRLLKICTAFKEFWAADDARAMLCVLNALPRAGRPEFDLQFLNEQFGLILKSLDIDINVDEAVRVLGGGSHEFALLKKCTLDRLAAGNKTFVITTYQSAGAGQNLQYPIPEGVRPVRINDRSASKEMDFDSLYLEEPTHTSPVILPGMEVHEADALRHILGCEYLYENAEITREELLKSISAALHALGGSGNDFGHKHTASARLLGAKQVYQATGRLCRTNMKMPVIRLFVDGHLMDGVPLDTLKSCGVVFTPEFRAIVDAFDAETPNLSAETKRLERKAAIASERSRSCINSLLGSGWRSESRKAWHELGEQVLRYPTLPGNGDVAPYMERNYYVEFPDERTSYRYTNEDDFKTVTVLLDAQPGVASFAVSERATRLDMLMRIPGMKAHFEAQGYVTEWKPSKKIMTPVVAESIYKGRLGEVCGKFVLEACGISVEGIDDAAEFEKFDFLLPAEAGGQKTYIDFKHWKKLSDKAGWGSEQLIDWVFSKMELIDARRAIIANVLPPDEGKYQQVRRSKNGRKLLIVPALVKGDCSFDETAIQGIRSYINGFENE